MPSITYWNRLEPRPRSNSIARSLRAEVRDPLWFLTRQWQFGEWRGEDAASPGFVRVVARTGRLQGWQADDPAAAETVLDGSAPLEAVVETEPFTPDTATAVEVGQRFEALLTEALGPAAAAETARYVAAFRAAYPLQRPDQLTTERRRDRALVRFLDVCAGRALDGIALLNAPRVAATGLPSRPTVATASRPAVLRALTDLAAYVRDVYGTLASTDAAAWRPERLEYAVRVSGQAAAGRVTLRGQPGRDGEFNWFSFDQIGRPQPIPGRALATTSQSLLPIHVRFRGMPNARFWQFEAGTTDFGAVRVDPRELAKVVVLDFVLVASNDWYVIPFPQPVGTLVQVDAVLVHDVFGDVTLVERTDRLPGRGGARWTMFTLSAPDEADGLADYALLPPGVGAAALSGDAVEEVRLLRDESANLVFAVEHLTEGGTGEPWQGHERAYADPREERPPPPAALTADLVYRLQTRAPDHWIPFVPVQVDAARREIALERAAFLRPVTGSRPVAVQPAGRLLRPTRLANPSVYRIREEEVPRSGVQVRRVPRRARWLDGSTWLWLAREKRAGAGEGSSGLRFDLAEPPRREGQYG